MIKSLEEITEWIKKYATRKVCTCGKELDFDNIYSYPHSDGWKIEGLPHNQWIYVTCNGCNYDWAVWKPGFKKDDIFEQKGW